MDKSLEKALEDFGFFAGLPKGSPDGEEPAKPPTKSDPPPPPPAPPVKEPEPKPEPKAEPEPKPEPLFVPGTEDGLTRDEREVILSPSNRKRLSGFLFGSPTGRPDTGFFCDAFALSHVDAANCWPTGISFSRGYFKCKGVEDYKFDTYLLDLISVEYPNKMSRTHGYRGSSDKHSLTLGTGEYVVKVYIRLKRLDTRTLGIDYLEFVTNTNKGSTGGYDSHDRDNILEWTPPKENMGLVGFFGEADAVVNRLGPIWKER